MGNPIFRQMSFQGITVQLSTRSSFECSEKSGNWDDNESRLWNLEMDHHHHHHHHHHNANYNDHHRRHHRHRRHRRHRRHQHRHHDHHALRS